MAPRVMPAAYLRGGAPAPCVRESTLRKAQGRAVQLRILGIGANDTECHVH